MGMKVDLELCPGCADAHGCQKTFLSRAEALNLNLTLETSLKKYPANHHLHLVLEGQKTGTLEYTILLEIGRSFLSLRTDRSASWVSEITRVLRENLTD